VRQIASNTGPILHLSEIGAIEILRDAGEIHIPAAVENELIHSIAGWSSKRPGWLRMTEVDPSHAVPFEPWAGTGVIHAGEAAALAIAMQIRADWFLTDDAAARLVGRTLGLEVHGSLGVILWAGAQQRIDGQRARDLLERLAASSLWMSPRVLAEARSTLQAICR